MLYWPRPRSQKNLPRIAVSLLIVNLSLAATDRLNEAQDTPKFYQSAGTRKMAPLLQQIYAEEDWKTDPNKDGVRAQYYKQMLETKPDLQNELKIREAVAKCDLRAGDFADAVEQLEQIRRLGSKWVMIFDSSFEKDVRDSLGIAYLRLGEQENCLINHGQDSCLIPLQGGGIHTKLRGAKGAVREFSAALEADPKDLKAQWLLNIACS